MQLATNDSHVMGAHHSLNGALGLNNQQCYSKLLDKAPPLMPIVYRGTNNFAIEVSYFDAL